jgi:chromosome partitioning protein
LNQKGGVGKTTVTLGIASAAWSRGVKTLVVDLDAQANATWTLGVEPTLDNWGTGDALGSNRPGSASQMILVSGWGESIWLLPAASDLVDRETEVHRKSAEHRLARALEGVTDDFELVLIDCPPSLGLNTVNGLTAATDALLVVEPTIYGLRGIEPVLDTIERVWERHNDDLQLAGVVLNKLPGVSTDAHLRAAELAQLVGSKTVWNPPIPQRVIVNEAHAARSPIHSYGQRAAELTDIFDAHLRRLLR